MCAANREIRGAVGWGSVDDKPIYEGQYTAVYHKEDSSVGMTCKRQHEGE